MTEASVKFQIFRKHRLWYLIVSMRVLRDGTSNMVELKSQLSRANKPHWNQGFARLFMYEWKNNKWNVAISDESCARRPIYLCLWVYVSLNFHFPKTSLNCLFPTKFYSGNRQKVGGWCGLPRAKVEGVVAKAILGVEVWEAGFDSVDTQLRVYMPLVYGRGSLLNLFHTPTVDAVKCPIHLWWK